MGRVVNVTPCPLYPQESPSTQCTGAVCPMASLNGCRKSCPTDIQYLYCPARSESLHRLCSPRSVSLQTVKTCCLVDRYSSFAESGPSMFTAHPLLLSFMMKRVSVMYHLIISKPEASFKDGQAGQSPPPLIHV